jgi:hypothetical protein
VVFDGLLKQHATMEELGGGEWKGEVHYGLAGGHSGDAQDITWSFDISTASFHITHALDHVTSYAPAGQTAPSHMGAIGVRRDAVDGVDVEIPYFTWEETHQVAAATVASYAWLTTMQDLVATINQAAFRIWAQAELLLLGISGQHNKLSDQWVPITYKFASARSAVNQTIGDITGVNRAGHNYLWIEYWPEEDTSALSLTRRPRAAHVERVYEWGDYTQLAILDPWS